MEDEEEEDEEEDSGEEEEEEEEEEVRAFRIFPPVASTRLFTYIPFTFTHRKMITPRSTPLLSCPLVHAAALAVQKLTTPLPRPSRKRVSSLRLPMRTRTMTMIACPMTKLPTRAAVLNHHCFANLKPCFPHLFS